MYCCLLELRVQFNVKDIVNKSFIAVVAHHLIKEERERRGGVQLISFNKATASVSN